MAIQTPNNRDPQAPAGNTKTLPLECTYPTCIKRFATLKEMKLHKKGAEDHYYCKKCDVDCEDWEELTQHKVTAMSPWVDGPMRGNREVLPQHIVCEFCGMEYKTFGARRTHREQCHPAEQSITCPLKECRIIFTKAAAFVRHLEDGQCEGVSAAEFRAYLEQVHMNKQIMTDTTISERLEENKRAAILQDGASGDDTDTEFGGVALSGASSIMDDADDVLRRRYVPLEPERSLLGSEEPRSSLPFSESQQWSVSTASLSGSMRSLSMSSDVPSINGTELSASKYALHIAGLTSPATTTRSSSSTYTESYPSLHSPFYAASTTSDAGSEATAGAGSSKSRSAWTTGSTSKALFPDAKPTPPVSGNSEELIMDSSDLRNIRWWDPNHSDFDPDVFRCKDLMEVKTFSCPFAECEDNYGYENVDDLKAHIRHAHLSITFQCPSCHKRFPKPSSLVAHSESSGKCKVQGSAYYKHLIADISGGFLKAKSVVVPKIFRPEDAPVLENGMPVNGIMQTEFKARIPRGRKERVDSEQEGF